MRMTKGLCVVGCLLAGLFVRGTRAYAEASAASGTESATRAPVECAPATSQPASNIVLIRLGDRFAVTQRDYDVWMRRTTVNDYRGYTNAAMGRLTALRLFELYLDEHPELVSQELLDAKIKLAMKNMKVKTLEELDKKLKSQGTSLRMLRRELRAHLGRSELIRQAEAKAKDEAYLKKRFEQAPREFDGTTVACRRILLRTAPHETSAEKAAKRARLAKIREDLLAGRRTWEECVVESEGPKKRQNGYMGYIPRHGAKSEWFGEVLFALKENEISEVVETDSGFHLIQVVEHKPGSGKFDKQTKRNIQLWLHQEVFSQIHDAMKKKYPVAGVRSPLPPAHLREALARQAASVPASQPATVPARSTGS